MIIGPVIKSVSEMSQQEWLDWGDFVIRYGLRNFEDVLVERAVECGKALFREMLDQEFPADVDLTETLEEGVSK